MKIQARRAVAQRWFPLRWGIPYMLLTFGSALAIVTAVYVLSTVEARVRSTFLTDAQKARHEIEARLNTHFDVVQATAALLTANNEINGAEFRAFVMALHLHQQYPGLSAIGFAPRLAQENLKSFLKLANMDGTRLMVRARSSGPDCFPVMFLEPRDAENRASIGFDLSADGMASAAIERARDTGQSVLARSVALASPSGEPPGTTLLLFVPIFQRGASVETVEERRSALVGLVLSTIDMDDMLHVVSAANESVAFEIYDSDRPDAGAVRYSSAAWRRLFGYQSAETVQVAGQPWQIIVRLAPRADVALQAGRVTLGTGLLLTLLLFGLTRAQVRGWESAARHQEDLQQLALHDPLTDLPNRALLDDRLAKAIAAAKRSGRRLAVLFLDVDRFKQINDVWGHAIGDELLRSVAERLLASVRRSDTVSRHGGDELDITVSIGVSVYPDDGLEAAMLLQAADAAMYQAKDRGRNTCQFFTAEMNAQAIARHTIEAGLRRALDRQELVLHYQPKIALETGAISGVEAMVRWRDPDRGLIGPTEFVSIAEESGLIVPLGRWALREACEQAQSWVKSGFPVAVAVNVSAIELRSQDFLDHAKRVLRETGLDPRYLELELTESILMRHAPSTVEVLQALRALGVTIAIDDFGTGYSSVTYLRQFPVDVLKVDQSFIHEVTTSAGGSPIVSAMISMGRSLGHRVIAEGVETLDQFAFLRAQQCSEGQGFYFSRPLPADQLTAAWAAQPSGVFLRA
jgi:EAL domain-containing protein (putative c-di-GMP-specific phosphodiesterase class I)/GGDEF domain-containing protein/CHASE1-domain containing sensor protein